MQAALWEAVRAGIVLYQESNIRFLHDRIQQAAYSLIPDAQRAGLHLRIGRVLLAGMVGDDLAEHLFDVAEPAQSRAAALLVDPDEKAQVAEPIDQCWPRGGGQGVGCPCLWHERDFGRRESAA